MLPCGGGLRYLQEKTATPLQTGGLPDSISDLVQAVQFGRSGVSIRVTGVATQEQDSESNDGGLIQKLKDAFGKWADVQLGSDATEKSAGQHQELRLPNVEVSCPTQSGSCYRTMEVTAVAVATASDAAAGVYYITIIIHHHHLHHHAVYHLVCHMDIVAWQQTWSLEWYLFMTCLFV